MTEAVEPLYSRSETQWWSRTRSFGDIAEHFERTFKDRQNLERKLAVLLEENKRLANRCVKADAELAARSRTAGHGRHDAELAVRERLLKDEFEREAQELQIEMNKERRQFIDRVEHLKKELAGCFCRQHSEGYVVHVKKGPEPKVPRKRP